MKWTRWIAPACTFVAFSFVTFGDDHGAIIFLIVANLYLYTRGAPFKVAASDAGA
jgi:hypothetical protein